MKPFLLPLLFLLSAAQAEGQSADTNTLTTLEGILGEVLAHINREPDDTPDWEAFRDLFLPTARFTILNHDPAMSEAVESVSLEEFIAFMQDAYYEAGFHEYETGRSVDEYNGIAQVFQSFHALDSEGAEGRGITSYQLAFFDGRWWIVSVLWTGDGNGMEVPRKYLDE